MLAKRPIHIIFVLFLSSLVVDYHSCHCWIIPCASQQKIRPQGRILPIVCTVEHHPQSVDLVEQHVRQRHPPSPLSPCAEHFTRRQWFLLGHSILLASTTTTSPSWAATPTQPLKSDPDSTKNITTVTITIPRPQTRLGIQLVDTTTTSSFTADGDSKQRSVPAIQRILKPSTTTTSNNSFFENDDNYQRLHPGMILPDFESAASVQLYLTDPNIPYPKQLVFQSVEESIMEPDDGNDVLTTHSFSTASSSPLTSNSLQITKVKSMKVCGIQSRSGDVMEIVYEARYIANNNNNVATSRRSSNDPDSQNIPVLYDSSAQRGTGLPYQFVLGSGDMLPGVDQGLYNTCPGEIRILTIPPALAYGSRGNSLFGIPPNSILVWNVEVIAINGIRKEEKDENDIINDNTVLDFTVRTREEMEQRVPYTVP